MYATFTSTCIVVLATALMMPAVAAQDAAGLRILFLSKSQAFEHSPVAQKDGKTSVAEIALAKIAKEIGATLVSTKDADQINAENLEKYDLVILYTQGDLTKDSKDGGSNISETGQADLVEWVEKGGRYMGFHSASDTFHTPRGGEVTPYLKMVGGEFISHGGQFAGAVKIVDPSHPAVANIPADYKPREEWYLFHNFNTESIRVLALLDPGEARVKQKDKYNIPDYPIIWVNAVGEGKVYFSAFGHRNDMWEEDPVFHKSVIDAIAWLMTEGKEGTEPNFDQVVPKEIPAK